MTSSTPSSVFSPLMLSTTVTSSVSTSSASGASSGVAVSGGVGFSAPSSGSAAEASMLDVCSDEPASSGRSRSVFALHAVSSSSIRRMEINCFTFISLLLFQKGQDIRLCREQRRISSLSVFIWQGPFDQKTAHGNISHYLRYLSALHPGFLQARGCCPRPKCR